MIQAVIFYMDGTMVNTEYLWRDINHKLANHFGKMFDESMRVYMMGRKEYAALSIFKEYYQIKNPVEELMMIRKSYERRTTDVL